MDLESTIFKQIHQITSTLIQVGLSVEQNFPSINGGYIYISGKHDLSVALKNIAYKQIYDLLESEKNYNIKLIDGALLQFMYIFSEGKLKKYRLAFFPSPTLEEYQNNQDIYELDEIYSDILSKNIIPTPIRFDFDPENAIPVHHPSSHLTIGQYQNCRIPVTFAITPNMFMDFILRNFYNTAQSKYSVELKFKLTSLFENCIEPGEKSILHLTIHS